MALGHDQGSAPLSREISILKLSQCLLLGAHRAGGRAAHQISFDVCVHSSWTIFSEQKVPEHLKNTILKSCFRLMPSLVLGFLTYK